jgi:hypothetical protein
MGLLSKMLFEKLFLIRLVGVNPPKSPFKRGTKNPVPLLRGVRGDLLGFASATLILFKQPLRGN